MYVFGPLAEKPTEAELAVLQPDQHLLVCLIPMDAITSGRLPVIGHDSSFSRERWPMPWFSVESGMSDFPIDAVRTSDEDPFAVVETRPISRSDARDLPEYRTTSVEAILDKLQYPDLPLPRPSDRV